MAEEGRPMETGYKRKRWKICDMCGSRELDFTYQKEWIRCENCGKIYSKGHEFAREIE